MRALKYLLVSLLVVSIVKRTRTQDNQQPLIQQELATITPTQKLVVKKGFKTTGYYIPDKKIVQSSNGQTLFVNVIEEKKGNYKKTGNDDDKVLVTKPHSTEILEKIGTTQHLRIVPERPSKVTLYGIHLKKPIIHTT